MPEILYPFTGTYPVSNPFGVVDAAYSRYPGSKHSGVDWSLPTNTPLSAAITGTVKTYRSEAKTGRGNEVWITDSNLSVRCCHMGRVDVTDGQRVRQGQLIGVSGYTGYVVDAKGRVGTPGGAHLHFEVLVDGQYVNPLKVITRGEDMQMTRGVMAAMKFLATRQNECTDAEYTKYSNDLEGFVQYLTAVQAEHNVSPMVVDQTAQAQLEKVKKVLGV